MIVSFFRTWKRERSPGEAGRRLIPAAAHQVDRTREAPTTTRMKTCLSRSDPKIIWVGSVMRRKTDVLETTDRRWYVHDEDRRTSVFRGKSRSVGAGRDFNFRAKSLLFLSGVWFSSLAGLNGISNCGLRILFSVLNQRLKQRL